MRTTIQIRQQGRVTLPRTLRQKYNIQAGDILQIIDLDGLFILTPKPSLLPQLAHEIEQICLDTGLKTEELLQALRQERNHYFAENSPQVPSVPPNTRRTQP